MLTIDNTAKFIKIHYLSILISLILVLVLINSLYDYMNDNGYKCNKSTNKTDKNEPYENPINKKYEITLYYATWCSWSRDFLPTWKLFKDHVKNYYPDVAITEVICDERQEKCMVNYVPGFPSVIFFNDGHPTLFNSENRDLNALKRFIKESVGTS